MRLRRGLDKGGERERRGGGLKDVMVLKAQFCSRQRWCRYPRALRLCEFNFIWVCCSVASFFGLNVFGHNSFKQHYLVIRIITQLQLFLAAATDT